MLVIQPTRGGLIRLALWQQSAPSGLCIQGLPRLDRLASELCLGAWTGPLRSRSTLCFVPPDRFLPLAPVVAPGAHRPEPILFRPMRSTVSDYGSLSTWIQTQRSQRVL